MCEAIVYWWNGGGQPELLLDAVDKVVPGDVGTLYLENIYGERKTVSARITRMELVDHKIYLEPVGKKPVPAARKD